MQQSKTRIGAIQAAQWLVSAGIILGCLLIGRVIQYGLNDAFPGAIIGMLLLFLLLVTRLVPLKWVKPTGSLLLQYMMVLFIPICVGVMQHVDLLITHAVPILASVIGATVIVLVLMSVMLEKQLTKKDHD